MFLQHEADITLDRPQGAFPVIKYALDYPDVFTVYINHKGAVRRRHAHIYFVCHKTLHELGIKIRVGGFCVWLSVVRLWCSRRACRSFYGITCVG